MVFKKRKIFMYATFPGIIPRVIGFFSSGFQHLAYLIAIVYHNAGILPAGHPYLLPQNLGRFGVRHVIVEAANRLTFSRDNLDKIILFFTILIGLCLLFVQFLLLIVSFVSNPAFAGPISAMFLTTTYGPTQDIAFVVLDRVFGAMNFWGVWGFFGSCVSIPLMPCINIRGDIVSSPATYPLPFHDALHDLMYFYTLGIAFFAVMVIIYHIIAIVGETVVSGTPFGRRFSRAWFVPRLIVFFALIAPITFGANVGFNYAQIITLGVAKFGSNFATNAWIDFNGTITDTLLGDKESLIAEPNVPDVGALTQFLYVARMCMFGEKILHDIDIYPYIVRPKHATFNPVTTDDYMPYLTQVSHSNSFEEALKFSRYGTVTLRFGQLNPPGTDGTVTNPPGEFDQEWGYVKPTCGEISFDTNGLYRPTTAAAALYTDPVVSGNLAGGIGIQEQYYLSIDRYLTDTFYNKSTYCMLKSLLPYDHNTDCVNTPYAIASVSPLGTGVAVNSSLTQLPSRNMAVDTFTYYNMFNQHQITGRYHDYSTYAHHYPFSVIDMTRIFYDYSMSPLIAMRGWAGAALWYNKIAEINGAIAGAVVNVPRVTAYPLVMEQVARQHEADDEHISIKEKFNPKMLDGQMADLPRPGDQYMASALYVAYSFWAHDDIQTSPYNKPTGSSVIDVINLLIGTNGLYDLLENDGTHPLAMLSALGKSMVDAAIRNLFIGIGGQGVGEFFKGFIGGLGEVGSSFMFRFGMIGLSIGFVLYYILPILPFVYFFFAFSGWIKSIFEAVMAMPLWALAHIKMDGEGLPGPWATNGYFLLLEIFLRPTLIIFGFLASITLYSALVDGVNDLFYLAAQNVGGFNFQTNLYTVTAVSPTQSAMDFMRGPLDEFFLTALYAIIVYMLALSCFKLIDQIPNNIMRWMGVTVSTFQEHAGDPAGELMGRMYHSSQITSAQLTTMVGQIKGWKGTLSAEDAYIAGAGR